MQLMKVSPSTETMVAAEPPKVTPVAPVKPVPVIVTAEPPAGRPEGGTTLVTAGCG